MKDKFVVIEYDLHKKGIREVSVVFGPFNSRVEADDFCNRRIAILSTEWFAEEDGAIINHLSWEIHESRPVNT